MRYNMSAVNPTLFNLTGDPFYGKLVFVAPGTSKTYRNVFDVDNHNLGHVIITNQHGRLSEQIILDGTYDMQMWEFVGTVFDVDDDTQWQLIRTERIIDPSDNITLSVDGAMSFQTVSDMREFSSEGLNDTNTCFRMGYYFAGDHEPLAYVWDPECTDVDDGGSIIKPADRTSRGRWVAMFPERINIKWFGVKEAPLESLTTYQSSSMLAAQQVALHKGKTLYFPCTGESAFYGCDSVTLDVGNADIIMDAGVRLVGKSGSTNTLSCFNLYCDRDATVFIAYNQDPFAVSAHEVWTASMANYGEIKADIVHWNKSIRKTSWRNCQFVFETAPGNTMAFTNCVLDFASDEYKLEPSERSYTFYDMLFTDKYFKTGLIDYGYINVGKDCSVDIASFSNPVNWFNLMQDWGMTSIDCHGYRMDSVTLKINTRIVNGNISTMTVSEGIGLFLDNSLVDALVFNDGSQDVTMISSTAGAGSSITCNNLNVQDSKLLFVSDSILCQSTAASLERSQFLCKILTMDFAANSCTFADAIGCVNFAAYGSSFLGAINVGFMEVLRVVCINNVIGAACQMNIARNPASTAENVLAVGCRWVGNTIHNTNFWIMMDRLYLHPDDKEHDYVYSNNNGSIQPGQPITFETNMTYAEVMGSDMVNFTGVHVGPTYGNGQYIIGGKSTGIKWTGNPIPDFFLFTIGTVNVDAHIEVDLLGPKMKDMGLSLPYIPAYAGLKWVFDFNTNSRIRYEYDGTSGYSIESPLLFKGGYSWQFKVCAKEKSQNFDEYLKLKTFPMSIGIWLGPTEMYDGIINATHDSRVDVLVWRLKAVTK